MRYLYYFFVMVLLAGCSTSQLPKDIVSTQNNHLDVIEEAGTANLSNEVLRRLEVLFSDQPEYTEIARRGESGAKLPRMRTSVPPRYPTWAYLTKTEAIVKVAFIISENGKVEYAKIYEASDDRFSEAALDSVQKWTFYPGTINGSPEKFVFIAPVHFEVQK